MAEPGREAQRVLVTGAAGFIGFHLAARLLGAGAWCTASTISTPTMTWA
jgi:nucleoside-diphosphate-sugar epimerase